MTSLLDELPAWQQHLAEVAAVRAEVDYARAQVEAARAGHQEALRAHAEAVKSALAARQPVPPAPPARDVVVDHAAQGVAGRASALHAAGERLRVELAPEAERIARERWAAARGKLAKAAQAIADATAALQADAQEVARLRAAAEQPRRQPSAGQRTKTDWDANGLVAAVLDGSDPFAMRDPGPQVHGLTRRPW